MRRYQMRLYKPEKNERHGIVQKFYYMNTIIRILYPNRVSFRFEKIHSFM